MKDIGEIVIPELEEALRSPGRYRLWDPLEEEIIRRYYQPGMAKAIQKVLAKLFPPGRSLNAIYKKARELREQDAQEV